MGILTALVLQSMNIGYIFIYLLLLKLLLKVIFFSLQTSLVKNLFLSILLFGVMVDEIVFLTFSFGLFVFSFIEM